MRLQNSQACLKKKIKGLALSALNTYLKIWKLGWYIIDFRIEMDQSNGIQNAAQIHPSREYALQLTGGQLGDIQEVEYVCEVK